MDAVISCMMIIHPLLKEVECFFQKSWFLFINRRNDDDVVLLIHLRWRECIFDVISRSLTASPKNVYSLFLSAIRWGCDTALIFFYSQRTRLYFCWISLRSRKSLRDSCIDPLHWTGIKPSLCLSQMVVQSQCPYSYLHTTCQSPNKRSIQQGQKLSEAHVPESIMMGENSPVNSVGLWENSAAGHGMVSMEHWYKLKCWTRCRVILYCCLDKNVWKKG